MGDRPRPHLPATPSVQLVKPTPEILQRGRDRRPGQFGLILRAGRWLRGPLEQPLQGLTQRDALVVALREVEFVLGEGDQLFAEASIKAASSFR